MSVRSGRRGCRQKAKCDRQNPDADLLHVPLHLLTGGSGILEHALRAPSFAGYRSLGQNYLPGDDDGCVVATIGRSVGNPTNLRAGEGRADTAGDLVAKWFPETGSLANVRRSPNAGQVARG